jgi:UDP-N-acetylmuramate dehydrogenase
MDIKVEQNIALSQFTTYNVGGPARFFARASDWKGIFGLREFAKKQGVPFLILGGGSNVLFSDEGYPGLVILNHMNKVQFHTHSVTAESGAMLSKVIVLAARHNLGGASGLVTVPGTIGGAVYGNAGIPDMWISNVFMHAEILPTDGNGPIIVGPEYCQFSYRTSRFKRTNDIILSATLKLIPTPAPIIQSEINEYVKVRTLKQPIGLSCGSFFKNPGQFPSAGWLIDQAGCKGMKVGGAQVSEKHANFIMNTGNATASDIIELAKQIHKNVDEKFNILLEPEVQILPRNPFYKRSNEMTK